jgi:uncharacterized repeat protein (TIGR04076 family)
MKYKKSKYKISAKLIKKGSCPYHKEGLTFQLTGFTPNGLCDSAYAVISRDALALRYGVQTFPGRKMTIQFILTARTLLVLSGR